jgi:hypothetical protein
MDCHAFRKHHLAYLDDTLPSEFLVAAERHLLECEACAHFDTAVRRGLMLFRSLEPVQVTPEFRARLQARLREVRPFDAGADRELDALGFTISLGTHDRALPRRVADLLSDALRASRGRTIAAAAGFVIIGTVAAAAWSEQYVAHEVTLAPVVATLPEVMELPPLDNRTLMAAVTTSFPSWSTALLAEQGGRAMQATLVSYHR